MAASDRVSVDTPVTRAFSPFRTDPPPDVGPEQPGQLVTPELLNRIAGTLAIMPYEMELFPDGSFRCLEFTGLASVLGSLPAGSSDEQAFDSAVHPEDRKRYDAVCETLNRGEAAEVEYRLVGYDGRTRWVLDRMHPRRTNDGRLLVDGMVADITERKRAEEELLEARKLAYLALHDPLTDLPNRVAFEEHLSLALARAGRQGFGVAVLFVDLDNLKLVNDSFGHAAGDEVLQLVAARLGRVARAADLVARQGGDEFLMLLTDLPRRPDTSFELDDALRQAEHVARRVRRVLREPFVINGIEIFMTASVGISLYPSDAEDGHALLKHADIAMYAAKAAGRDGYRRYAFNGDDPLANLSMAGRLHRVIDEDRGLVLHYQPIVKLDTGEMVGAEALIRWDDEDRGLLLPDEFLPLAERVGLIGPISDWVIRTACEQASQWQASSLDLYLSINLPPAYCEPTGIRRLLRVVEAFGLKPDQLVIEITESAVMARPWREVEPALSELRRRGLRLAIDDFGTGHSSLGRLNRSWVSMLKIDSSFVRDLPADTDAGALVASIIQLARNLGLELVAEGIETEDQRRFLVDRACGLGQGFLFSRPVPPNQIENMRSSSKVLGQSNLGTTADVYAHLTRSMTERAAERMARS